MTLASSNKPARTPTDTEIAQMRRESAAVSAYLFASDLHFRHASQLLEITLKSGVVIGIPIAVINELRDATPEQLRTLELVVQGSALHQEELDVDMSIPNLIREVLGIARLQ